MKKMRLVKKLVFVVCAASLVIILLYLYRDRVSLPTISYKKLHALDKKAKMFAVEIYVKNRSDKKCDIFVESVKISNATWQNVSNSDVVLYSAFIDARIKNNEVVRLLGMAKENNASLYCRIWVSNNESVAYPIVKQEIWGWNWNRAKERQYYRPFLLSCPLPKSFLAVSVTTKSCDEPKNFYPIQKTHQNKHQKKDFVVCLKPLNFVNDISDRLLEWLELQFLLGADKVAVYVFEVHPMTMRVLRYYQKLKKLSIKFHTLPEDEKSKWRKIANNTWQKRRHEIIPYNDCFYSHIDTHKYVVILDLDEAIIPLQHDNWKELLSHVISQNPKTQNYSSLSVSNVYFFDSFGKTNEKSIPPSMHMLRHVYRSANFTPSGFAMKSFFSTEAALTVFNHYALSGLRHQVLAVTGIQKDLVQLHHYRVDCPPLMEKDCKNNFMKFKLKDTVIWKFKERLIENVISAKSNIKLSIDG